MNNWDKMLNSSKKKFKSVENQNENTERSNIDS